MKGLFIPAVLLSMLLAGCAAPRNPAMDSFNNYVATAKPQAESGTLKWSQYYTGLHSHGQAARAPGFMLAAFNEAIRVSEEFEAGRISEADRKYKIRALEASTKSMQEDLAASAREEHRRQQQVGAAQMAAGAQMMQASQPYALPQLPAAPQAYQPQGNAYVTGYLRSQSQNGTLRLCNYSNGVVITVASHQMCAMSTN